MTGFDKLTIIGFTICIFINIKEAKDEILKAIKETKDV